MLCPACKESGAYTGLQWVHCQNVKCGYFDARYTEAVAEEAGEIQAKAEKLTRLRKKFFGPED